MAITCSDFYAIGVRLDLLDVETVMAAGVTLSPREIVAFRSDPLRFFMEQCGPTRRQEIFAFVEQPRSRSTHYDPRHSGSMPRCCRSTRGASGGGRVMASITPQHSNGFLFRV